MISTVPLPFAGILVPPGHPRAIGEAVRELWSRPDEVARLARRNVELAQGYTWERHTTALLDLYAEVLGERHGAGRP